VSVMTLDQAAAPASAPSQNIPQLAQKILAVRGHEQGRLKRISKYMRGRHDSVYVPRGAREEYRWLLHRSVVNFLPLIVSTISQNLHVDGYRPTASAQTIDDVTEALAAAHDAISAGDHEQAASILAQARTSQVASDQADDDPGPWRFWTANRMGSRQHGLHRAVIKYGVAYVTVLPGDPVPVICPKSPRRMTALYADDVDDEWPAYAVEETTVNVPGGVRRIVRVYDDQHVYTLTGRQNSEQLWFPQEDDPLLLDGTQTVSEHGLGVCPVIRYAHEIDLDAETDVSGVVEPLIPLQDQLNTITFDLLMAMQYGAFRQRWVTGMVVADEEGNPVEPFRAGVDRLMVAEDATVKFGEFGQTDVTGFLKSAEATIQHMSTLTQLPPYYLLGQTVNLSADALTASRDALDRQVEELQGVLDEPYKQTMQLAAKAAGDVVNAGDDTAVIVWRDTGGRNYAATVDALGKLTQMLGVPATELWEKVPGVTADDVARWRKAASSAGALAELNEMLERSMSKAAMPPAAQSPGGGPPGDQNPNPDEPWQTDVLRVTGV
jgi:hypothetical protein